MCTEHPRRRPVIDNNVIYHNYFPLAERLARVTNTAREHGVQNDTRLRGPSIHGPW